MPLHQSIAARRGPLPLAADPLLVLTASTLMTLAVTLTVPFHPAPMSVRAGRDR